MITSFAPALCASSVSRFTSANKGLLFGVPIITEAISTPVILLAVAAAFINWTES